MGGGCPVFMIIILKGGLILLSIDFCSSKKDMSLIIDQCFNLKRFETFKVL